MTLTWCEALKKLHENAEGRDLRGDPGDWDSALHQLITEAYRKGGVDREDEAIHAVLIVLHEAIRGKTSLRDLAALCIGFSEGIIFPRPPR